MLFEQGVEKFLTPAEIRSSKPGDGLNQVDDAATSRKVEYTKSTDYFESLCTG
jgi:hypothetical protein